MTPEMPEEATSRPILRVRVVLPERGPAWLPELIASIQESGDAIVTHVTLCPRPAARRNHLSDGLLLAAYEAVDGRLFGRPGDPSLIVGLEPLARRINASADRRGMATAQPDLVFLLDAQAAGLDLQEEPPFGIWSFVHGASLSVRARERHLGFPPGAAELLLGQTITTSQLVVRAGGQQSVIGQIVSSVDRLSLRRGFRGHLGKLVALAGRSVSFLRSTGRLPDVPSGLEESVAAARNDWHAGSVVGGLTRIPFGYVRRLAKRKIAPERWVIAISRDRTNSKMSGRRTIPVSRGATWHGVG